jgi:hypothetical protein
LLKYILAVPVLFCVVRGISRARRLGVDGASMKLYGLAPALNPRRVRPRGKRYQRGAGPVDLTKGEQRRRLFQAQLSGKIPVPNSTITCIAEPIAPVAISRRATPNRTPWAAQRGSAASTCGNASLN